jgi:hypothetical protein
MKFGVRNLHFGMLLIKMQLMQIKKGELPRLECFHNGIILIVICFKMYSNVMLLFYKTTILQKNHSN